MCRVQAIDTKGNNPAITVNQNRLKLESTH